MTTTSIENLDLDFDKTTIAPFRKFKTNPYRTLNTIEDEWEAFEKIRNGLETSHPGQYVAIYGGEVVDCDVDRGTLLRRFYQNYGNKTVYITKIGEPKQIYKSLSPRRR